MKLSNIFKKYRWRFVFTGLLILLEAGTFLLFPLLIGFAINDILEGSYQGTIHLGILGIVLQVFGALRRFFDTRFYATLSIDLGDNMVKSLNEKPISVKSARLSMINEIVEFLENDVPELVNSAIGLVGVLVILATLNIPIVIAASITALLVLLVYVLSSKYITRYNQNSNDQLELQVEVLETRERTQLIIHLQKLMRWNIKLSDLETLNFSLTWVVLMALLLYAIVTGAKAGMAYGSLFALIMYVFQYMESIINLPYFYQKWLRLLEIKKRIETI